MDEPEVPPDKVCTPCLESNLIKSGVVETFKICGRCGEEYCLHGVSKLDPQYCALCCSDFKVVDVQEIITREVHNEQGDVTSSKNFCIRHITLSGLDWLFYNRAISTLDDIELDHSIEYHRAILNGMLNERDQRFVNKIGRNRGKKAGNESTPLIESPLYHTGDGAKLSISRTTTRTTRVKTVRTTESGASVKAEKTISGIPANIMKSMMALGFTEEQVLEMAKPKT